jgi:hypothetical protein
MAPVSPILCPVDLSEGLRAALGYAAALADYFGARLTVITVDDPLLMDGVDWCATEELVWLAEAGRANLIVMGLHSGGVLGPRMGAVTCRACVPRRRWW